MFQLYLRPVCLLSLALASSTYKLITQALIVQLITLALQLNYNRMIIIIKIKMYKWAGCVAVVTGASSGIGRATAIKLAEEGMKVAALARREDRLNELACSFKGKGKIQPYKCDITDDTKVKQTFTQIVQNMGSIRVLVNSAGMSHRTKLIDFDIDLWRKTFNVNLFATFTCIRELMASVKQRNSNDLVHIININSLGGHYVVSGIDNIPYCCSKHSVTLLTRRLIREIAKENLNVKLTSLSPGAVETEILYFRETKFDYSKIPHLQPSDIANAAVAALSMPEDVIISELTVKSKGETL